MTCKLGKYSHKARGVEEEVGFIYAELLVIAGGQKLHDRLRRVGMDARSVGGVLLGGFG